MECKKCGSENLKKDGKSRGKQKLSCKDCGFAFRLDDGVLDEHSTPKLEGKKGNRTRNWIFIGYPESLPHNWRDKIDDLHIEWVESPLHDKDIEDESEPDILKKPHYHILLMFESVKSYEQIKEITDSLNSPRPERCHSPKGQIRYFVHKDHPHKYQYEWSDIKCHGGADLDSICKLSMNEVVAIIKEIHSYIDEKEILEYSDLNACLLAEGKDDYFAVVSNHTIHFNAHLRSLRHKTPKVDPNTGEIYTEDK